MIRRRRVRRLCCALYALEFMRSEFVSFAKTKDQPMRHFQSVFKTKKCSTVKQKSFLKTENHSTS